MLPRVAAQLPNQRDPHMIAQHVLFAKPLSVLSISIASRTTTRRLRIIKDTKKRNVSLQVRHVSRQWRFVEEVRFFVCDVDSGSSEAPVHLRLTRAAKDSGGNTVLAWRWSCSLLIILQNVLTVASRTPRCFDDILVVSNTI